MALNETAIFTAATGFVYTGPVGTAKPTPAQISAFTEAAGLQSEQQTITITGTPTGGTFTLTYSSQTTSAIPYNATAAAVKSALEALSNIEAGDIIATGGPLPGSPVVVTFTGSLAGTNVAQMTSTPSLTGGSTPTVTVTTSSAGAGWTDLGHTSREDLPEFGFEGGETETRGTWRAAALREVVTEVAVDYVIVTLHQFDEEGLSLYYGVENASTENGEFAVADSATSTVERSICIVMVDGDVKIAFYAPRVSIRREDSIEMAVDEFALMPIRATFLKPTSGNLFTWINETVLNPA
jgi:hypothetical protein